MERFGAYIRKLRKQRGLTLKEVEKAAQVSNAYLSLLERGLRRPPRPDILKRMATVYEVPQRELMVAAGYLEEDAEEQRKKKQMDQAYQHAISDPAFHHGTRLKGANIGPDVKRFIVEMYEQATGRKLLN